LLLDWAPPPEVLEDPSIDNRFWAFSRRSALRDLMDGGVEGIEGDWEEDGAEEVKDEDDGVICFGVLVVVDDGGQAKCRDDAGL